MAIRLVFGLGNPGSRYAHTRHNVGFEVLDRLAQEEKLTWCEDARGPVHWCSWGAARLIKPATFMNLSGTAVRGWADWLKVLPEEILVVLDDVALPWGRLRFRCGGSSGGHNGLLSIETALASDRYPRLRCGVGPVPPLWDRKDFVLARLPASDEAAWQEVLAQGAEAIRYCLGQGIELAMNVFNRRAEKDSKES